MNLTRSRATLIANVCALLVACAIFAEALYITREMDAYYHPGTSTQASNFLVFMPALLMFLVWKRSFSYCLLLMHIAVAIVTFLPVLAIYLGTYRHTPSEQPLMFVVLFLMLSLVCLAIWIAFFIVRAAILVLRNERPTE